MLFIVAFGILDPNGFYLTQAVRDVLMESSVDGKELTMSSVNSIDDFWEVSHFALSCIYNCITYWVGHFLLTYPVWVEPC